MAHSYWIDSYSVVGQSPWIRFYPEPSSFYSRQPQLSSMAWESSVHSALGICHFAIHHTLKELQLINFVETPFVPSLQPTLCLYALPDLKCPQIYPEYKYGGPLGRRPGWVTWKQGKTGFDVLFWQCFPRKVLPHCWVCLFCFILPKCVCIPECHQKRVKSSTAEKVFFYLWEENKQMEARSSWSLKELFKFGLEDLRKCASDCI